MFAGKKDICGIHDAKMKQTAIGKVISLELWDADVNAKDRHKRKSNPIEYLVKALLV